MKTLISAVCLCVICMSTQAQSWTKVGTTPISALQGSLCLSHNNKGYFFCGSTGYSTFTDSTWEFDPATNTWTALAVFPGGHRYLQSGFVLGDTAYVGFGQDDGSFALHNDFYAYSFLSNTWTKKASLPAVGRDDAGACIIGKYGYIVAGTKGGPPYLTDAYRYNTATNKWDTLASLPGSGKSGATVFTQNGEVFVAGGWVNPNGSRDVYAYDTSVKTWTYKGHITKDSGYSNQRIFSLCGTQYFVTGGVYDTTYHNKGGKDVFNYDATSNTWTKLATFPGVGRDHSMAFSANGIGYLVGGVNRDGGSFTVLNDIWKYSAHDSVYRYDTTICFGKTVILKANHSSLLYTWSTGDTTQGISISNAAGKYWVSITNAGACSSTIDSFIVNVITLTPALHDTALCAGHVLTLDAGNTGAKYLWSTNDTTETLSTTTGGKYSVTVSFNACSLKDSAQVTYKSNPAVTLGHDTTLCYSTPFTLNTHTSGSVSYKWSTGDTSSYINVSTSGAYSVTVSNNGCTASDTINVTFKGGNSYGWTNVGAMSIGALQGSLCLSYNNKGYFFCGSRGYSTFTDSTWVYDPAASTWTVLASFPGGHRYLQSGFVLGDTAYVGFGQDDGSFALHNDFYAYSFLSNTWTKKASLPAVGRDDAGACIIGKYGYIVAGTKGGPPYLTDAYRYNTATNKWDTLASLPGSGKSGATVFTQNGEVFAAGGWVNPYGSRDVYAYDTSAKTWAYKGHITKDSGFSNQRIFVLGGKQYFVTGGVYDTTYSVKGGKDVFNYDASSNTWTELSLFPGWGRDHSMAFSANGIGYLVGGVNRDGGTFTVLNDIWKYTMAADSTTTIDTSLCYGKSVILHVNGANQKYSWSTGDSISSVSVSTAGSYWVKVKNLTTCANTVDTFKVISVKLVNTIHDTTLCQGQPLTLDAGNTGSTYMWNTSATTQTIPVTTGGKYTVSIGFKGCTQNDTATITFKPLPLQALHDTGACLGSTLTLNARNSGAHYMWNTGDTTQTITCTVTKEYSVTINLNGCVGQDSAMVSFKATPVVQLGNDTTICLGNTLLLNAGNAGAKYIWNTGDTSKILNVNKSNTYSVIVNQSGCLGYDTLKLTVNLSVPPMHDTALCAGQPVILNAGNAGASYVWSNTDTTQTINVTTSGTYKVTISLNGCHYSDSSRVTFSASPLDSLGMDTTICAGHNLVLNAGNTGATYIWSTSATTKTISVTTAGRYTVKINLGGCIAYDSVHVNVTPATTASYTYITTGDTVRFTNTSVHFTHVKWLFGDGASDTTANPTHIYSKDGIDTVKLIAYGICDNDTTQQIVHIVTLGVNDVNSLSTLSLYPNPTDNISTLEFSALSPKADITITNVLGEVMETQVLNAGINHFYKYKIDLTHLSAGLYLVQVKCGTTIRTLRLVKN